MSIPGVEKYSKILNKIVTPTFGQLFHNFRKIIRHEPGIDIHRSSK
jgi:hypothetical protein